MASIAILLFSANSTCSCLKILVLHKDDSKGGDSLLTSTDAQVWYDDELSNSYREIIKILNFFNVFRFIFKTFTLLLLHVWAIETFISSAEKKGETPEILLSFVFSASLREVSASLSEDSIMSAKKKNIRIQQI